MCYRSDMGDKPLLKKPLATLFSIHAPCLNVNSSVYYSTSDLVALYLARL